MPDILAIDPGLGGAFAYLPETGDPVVFDTPTFKPKGKTKRDFDVRLMAELMRPYVKPGIRVYLELVHAMPTQGGVSNFTFGRGRGLWEGIIAALGGETKLVTPQSWKKTYPELAPPGKEPKDKTSKGKKVTPTKAEKALLDKEKRLAKAAAKSKARELAAQMFPNLAHLFEKVKDDGRAEALLMAWYGRNQN